MAKNGNYTEVYSNGRHYEHREVATGILGRPLANDETVHHVNENGFDNQPKNLWVFRTNADHTRFHRIGKAIQQEDGTYISEKRKPENICLVCKTPCYRKYCSQQCAHIGIRKVEDRPSKTDLSEMVKATNFCAVGRKYGVTDNAIRKWMGLKK